MCYNPITIINPCKYVDINRQDRFLLQVPCGKCAECQKRKSSEWQFRTYYEFLNTFEKGGYCYFDTLTYDDDHLPNMSQVIHELPPIPCFRSSDIVKFLKRLRQRLKRKYDIDKDAFSYFICSEYGSKRMRPHYHILIFMRQSIDAIQLSGLISRCWNLGRTDGIPYKSAYYVNTHNCVKGQRLGDTLACVQYVTKYVEKDCKLQEIIDNRIKKAEIILAKRFDGMKSQSVEFKKLLTKIAGEVNQFHLQSLHYGELALRDIDLLELIKDGCLTMPSLNVKTRVLLPDYYARKIFYDRYKLHGNYGWQLNDDGKRYKEGRKPYLIKQIQSRLECLAELRKLHYDCRKLANYIINERGRFCGHLPESVIEDRLDTITHYVYSTQSDKANIGCGISFDFLGNSQIGYSPMSSDIIKFDDFIDKYVYLNPQYEAQLKNLYSLVEKVNDDAQNYYSRLQELKSLFKQFESL